MVSFSCSLLQLPCYTCFVMLHLLCLASFLQINFNIYPIFVQSWTSGMSEIKIKIPRYHQMVIMIPTRLAKLVYARPFCLDSRLQTKHQKGFILQTLGFMFRLQVPGSRIKGEDSRLQGLIQSSLAMLQDLAVISIFLQYLSNIGHQLMTDLSEIKIYLPICNEAIILPAFQVV